MSNISILSLKEMQNIQIEMMEYIHTVCKSNNINYYIAYGSLLGAVRHSGFIPWDDDIDIWLPRNDYEKLKLFFETNNTSPYLFVSNDTNKDFRAPLPKIIDTRTVLRQNYGFIEGMDLGVYIDLFILDGCGDSIKEARMHYREAERLYKNWIYSNQENFVDYHSKLYCLLRMFKNLPYKFIGYQKMINAITDHNKKKDYYKSNYVAALDFESYAMDKSIFQKEWFGEGKDVVFEGHRFRGPSNPDAILKTIYGNYMVLPPIEKRHSNHKYIAFWK